MVSTISTLTRRPRLKTHPTTQGRNQVNQSHLLPQPRPRHFSYTPSHSPATRPSMPETRQVREETTRKGSKMLQRLYRTNKKRIQLIIREESQRCEITTPSTTDAPIPPYLTSNSPGGGYQSIRKRPSVN